MNLRKRVGAIIIIPEEKEMPVDVAISLLREHGVDLENSDLPELRDRHVMKVISYHRYCRNVVKDGERISGDYIIQEAVVGRDSHDICQPGEPMVYRFTAEKGKISWEKI